MDVIFWCFLNEHFENISVSFTPLFVATTQQLGPYSQ